MRNYFIFDDIDSRDFGVYLTGTGTYNSPARAYNTIKVPGRSGDLLGIERRLENVALTYPAFLYADFAENIAALRSALLSRTGYRRLSDSYHPEEFRMAYFRGPLEVDARTQHDAGEFEIEFGCKPQRFLFDGEIVREYTAAGTIVNPTEFNSNPRIKVTGYGTLTLGSETITIANTYPYVVIDSDLMDCYHDTDNANAAVSFSSNDFPELAPGSTGITKSSTITKVEITPRWWRV